MPDLRYYKDYENEVMFSDKQLMWLDQLFESSDDHFYVISLAQILIPTNKFMIDDTFFKPDSRRLIKLIQKHKKSGVVIISGDRHYA